MASINRTSDRFGTSFLTRNTGRHQIKQSTGTKRSPATPESGLRGTDSQVGPNTKKLIGAKIVGAPDETDSQAKKATRIRAIKLRRRNPIGLTLELSRPAVGWLPKPIMPRVLPGAPKPRSGFGLNELLCEGSSVKSRSCACHWNSRGQTRLGATGDCGRAVWPEGKNAEKILKRACRSMQQETRIDRLTAEHTIVAIPV